MPLSRLAQFGLALGTGFGAGCVTFSLILKRHRVEPLQPTPHAALKYGQPSSHQLRHYENHVLSFDKRLRNPEWVLEHITKESSSGNGNRKSLEFEEDKGIEDRFRNRLSDFKGSGYDRGHLAPAANHKGSLEAMKGTFVMSNICPQVGAGFNRDYWARFERFVKKLTHICDDVYIVTGPLYLSQRTANGYVLQHPMIGEPPRLVAVPTHFYKVVLGELRAGPDAQGQRAIGAFVIPNAPIGPDVPITAFTVPIGALEEVAGTAFFPEFLNEERRLAVDVAAREWQALGRLELATLQMQNQPSSGLPDVQDASTLLSLPSTYDSELKDKVKGRPLRRTKSFPSSLPDAEPMPPLAPTDSGAEGGPPGASQKRTWVPKAELVPVPTTPNAHRHGAVHLCERTACKLPAGDWWQTATKASIEQAG